MTKTQQIRENLYCSDCKNCKLMVWETSSKMDKMTNKAYMTEHDETGTVFMVRCGWTKDNVFEPLKLLNCEGKQSYKGGNDD